MLMRRGLLGWMRSELYFVFISCMRSNWFQKCPIILDDIRQVEKTG
jgi:hypothetical protein